MKDIKNYLPLAIIMLAAAVYGMVLSDIVSAFAESNEPIEKLILIWIAATITVFALATLLIGADYFVCPKTRKKTHLIVDFLLVFYSFLTMCGIVYMWAKFLPMNDLHGTITVIAAGIFIEILSLFNIRVFGLRAMVIMADRDIVVFDLDGVVTDTAPYQHKAYNMMLEKYDKRIDDFTPYEGMSDFEISERLDFELTPEMIKEKERYFLELTKDIEPDIRAVVLIQSCVNEEKTLVLMSGRMPDTTMTLLDRMELTPYFSQIITLCEADVTKRFLMEMPELFIKGCRSRKDVTFYIRNINSIMHEE